ncbi:MAG TPA: hypothetical protein VGL59_23075 [Polyangia bacterium]|jgi:hypothetical protein
MNRGALSLSLASLLMTACASEPPPPPQVAARSAPAPEPPPPADETAAQAAALAAAVPTPVDAVVTALGVQRADLVWSPAKKTFAVVVPTKADAAEAPHRGRAKRPQPATIAVYAPGGERLGSYRALSIGAVSDLRFLGEERLFYLLPARPAPPVRAHGKGIVLPPPLRYALQPLKPGARPVACAGRAFIFSPAGDHVAYLAGDAKRQRLFADGEAAYPRRGWTTIQGDAAWSPDGASLALIESGAHPRLVVLVEFDNPSGDNTWPLPLEAAADSSLHVYWAGQGKLVVGPSLTKPLFATSFHRDPAPVVSMPAEPPAAAASPAERP